jgi:hypothetical protein
VWRWFWRKKCTVERSLAFCSSFFNAGAKGALRRLLSWLVMRIQTSFHQLLPVTRVGASNTTLWRNVCRPHGSILVNFSFVSRFAHATTIRVPQIRLNSLNTERKVIQFCNNTIDKCSYTVSVLFDRLLHLYRRWRESPGTFPTHCV